MTTTTLTRSQLNRLELPAIAKLVRADVAAAIKIGDLPSGLKLSIRCNSYSMGRSLYVTVKALPAGHEVLNSENVRFERDHPHDSFHSAPESARPRHAASMRDVLAKIENITKVYNWSETSKDGCDDYHGTNFYAHVVVDGDIENADRARLREQFDNEARTARAASLPKYYIRAISCPIEG